MRIKCNTTAIKPMYDWLVISKTKGIRDEKKLREILSLDPYKVEFQRYTDPNLPVCTITFEDAVDFFMNFDKKDFDNQRLAFKKEYFLKFYDDLDNRFKYIEMFQNITNDDLNEVSTLLANGLPNDETEDMELTILLTISIGNSMGWPYENYIHFDVCNLNMFDSKTAFNHVVAHEIHHMFFGSLVSEEMGPKDFFYINFAFEGLAVHFNNNAKTLFKPSKYPGDMLLIDKPSWDFFESEFAELFNEIKNDAKKAEQLDIDGVRELLTKYEQFSYTNLRTGETMTTLHYPTYYMGCYMWGIIDFVFGKEKLFDTLKNPASFESVYNEAAKKLNTGYYL